MEHTKKMILVDPRMMDSLQRKAPPVPDAATESLRDMDQQMRGVLDRNDMNLEDKTNLYQQYKDKSLGTVQIRPDERTKAVLSGSDEGKNDPAVIEQDVLQSVPQDNEK